MKALCLFTLAVLTSFTVQATSQTWESLNHDQKADILTFESDLFITGSKVVEYASYKIDFDETKISDATQKAFITKMIETFEREVSTEEIEQSEYQADGEPQITELYLLLAVDGKILGGKISYYQNGLDQEGQEGDINWQASLRVDENAEPFKSEDGVTYDDLYFEWSGH